MADCPEANQKCGAPTGVNRAKICVGCDSIPVEVTASNLGNCAPLPSESPSPVAVAMTPTPEMIEPTVTPMPVMPTPMPMDVPMMTMGADDGEELIVPEDTPTPITITAAPTMMMESDGPMPSMPVDMPPTMPMPSTPGDEVTDKDVDLSDMMMPSMDVMESPHMMSVPDEDGDVDADDDMMTSSMSPMPMSSDMASTTTPDEDDTSSTFDGGDISPEPSTEPICVDASLLAHLSPSELVFPSHRRASVLCDTRGSCATAGHMVHFEGRAMMMRSYCKLQGEGCVRTVKLVNSPKFKRGVRVRSKTDGLSFTSFAARYESKMEEHVLKTLIHMGL